MSRATRVLVTGAGGQVGVDLMDVLNGKEPTEVVITEPGPELVLRSTTAPPAA